jgi:hypothetical protein
MCSCRSVLSDPERNHRGECHRRVEWVEWRGPGEWLSAVETVELTTPPSK